MTGERFTWSELLVRAFRDRREAEDETRHERYDEHAAMARLYPRTGRVDVAPQETPPPAREQLDVKGCREVGGRLVRASEPDHG